MLEIRPDCEHCDCDLVPDSPQAMICSFECTFCERCVSQPLLGICPNCGGNFSRRPVRPPKQLQRFPASTERVVGGAGSRDRRA